MNEQSQDAPNHTGYWKSAFFVQGGMDMIEHSTASIA
jgi:hypothetical protein